MLLGLRSLWEGGKKPPPALPAGATSDTGLPWEDLWQETLGPGVSIGSRGVMLDLQEGVLLFGKKIGTKGKPLTDDELALILILAANELV